MTTKIKIGIVGSRTYTNKKKIKDLIFEIKNKHDDVEIVSGGQKDGADGFVRKFALELGMNYVEFPPCHYRWNMYCKLSPSQYDRPYYVSNYFKRNKQIAEYCDILVAFITDNKMTSGTKSTVDYATKKKKLVKILS